MQTQSNNYMTIAVVIGILLILSGLLTYSIYSYHQVTNQVADLTQDIARLQQQNSVLQASKNILDAHLDSYNQMLSRMIPDSEDYFSIIAALEKLAAQTGFSITKYTINVVAANAHQLAISVEGKGDAEAFFKFLQDYRYQGERLITNGKIEFATGNFAATKLDLNFYSKQAGSAAGAYRPIAQSDIALMQTIADKVNFVYKNAEDGIMPDYPTKPNPF